MDWSCGSDDGKLNAFWILVGKPIGRLWRRWVGDIKRTLPVGSPVQLKQALVLLALDLWNLLTGNLPADRLSLHLPKNGIAHILKWNSGNPRLRDWQDNMLLSWNNNRGMFKEIKTNMYRAYHFLNINWINIWRWSNGTWSLWRCIKFWTFRLLKGIV
jgi:hypothetical protein